MRESKDDSATSRCYRGQAVEVVRLRLVGGEEGFKGVGGEAGEGAALKQEDLLDGAWREAGGKGGQGVLADEDSRAVLRDGAGGQEDEVGRHQEGDDGPVDDDGDIEDGEGHK